MWMFNKNQITYVNTQWVNEVCKSLSFEQSLSLLVFWSLFYLFSHLSYLVLLFIIYFPHWRTYIPSYAEFMMQEGGKRWSGVTTYVSVLFTLVTSTFLSTSLLIKFSWLFSIQGRVVQVWTSHSGLDSVTLSSRWWRWGRPQPALTHRQLLTEPVCQG